MSRPRRYLGLACILLVGLVSAAHADRDEVRVAATTGRDAPGFLHGLLAAPILGGEPLTDIRPAVAAPIAGEHGIDFVFSCGDDGLTRVVRAGLDRQWHVISAEVLLVRTAPEPRRHRRQAVLAAAFERGERIHRIRWEQAGGRPSALVLDHDGGAVRLGLAEFERQRLDCPR